MDPDIVFKAANLASSALVALSALAELFSNGGFKQLVVTGYLLALAGATASLEFTPPHDILSANAPFLFNFLGRGITLIFAGALIIGTSTLSYLAATIVILVGIAYIGCAFLPHIDRPSNMRDPLGADDEVEGIV